MDHKNLAKIHHCEMMECIHCSMQKYKCASNKIKFTPFIATLTLHLKELLKEKNFKMPTFLKTSLFI